VTIVEVGPRDGLQNESGVIPTSAKIAFIDALADAGLTVIEATSFVSPSAVPQLADAGDVMMSIQRRPGVRYPVLVPNERGYDRARDSGVDAIALFTSATEAFCQANIRCSIDESFARFAPVIERARAEGVWIRGYVSVAFECPYSGPVLPAAPVAVARRLFDVGCDEVSIADTLGTATAEAVGKLLDLAAEALPFERTALHMHDTYGNAVSNIMLAYGRGIRIFDSAAGGLGGCPFAPGASGNVATEAVVRAFDDRGIATGMDAGAVERAAHHVMSARIDSAAS
jgi:isopropylmalate/homocitrate/citramalate synthase